MKAVGFVAIRLRGSKSTVTGVIVAIRLRVVLLVGRLLEFMPVAFLTYVTTATAVPLFLNPEQASHRFERNIAKNSSNTHSLVGFSDNAWPTAAPFRVTASLRGLDDGDDNVYRDGHGVWQSVAEHVLRKRIPSFSLQLRSRWFSGRNMAGRSRALADPLGRASVRLVGLGV